MGMLLSGARIEVRLGTLPSGARRKRGEGGGGGVADIKSNNTRHLTGGEKQFPTSSLL